MIGGIWNRIRRSRYRRFCRVPFTGNETSRHGYERRIEDVVESLHTQLLYLAEGDRQTVSVAKLGAYFRHLERVLYGYEREGDDVRPVRAIVGSQETKEMTEHGRSERL